MCQELALVHITRSYLVSLIPLSFSLLVVKLILCSLAATGSFAISKLSLGRRLTGSARYPASTSTADRDFDFSWTAIEIYYSRLSSSRAYQLLRHVSSTFFPLLEGRGEVRSAFVRRAARATATIVGSTHQPIHFVDCLGDASCHYNRSSYLFYLLDRQADGK